ncbi:MULTISPECIES: TetR/AcrR family transcriptional regulator [unclassified Bradyrhizobium]|uniref:TetR/AcrR family transcriptional regulator n=1 Tax=unclassified Bradyrhizobium TaxID=2631580 RepID=UPI00102E7B53|nr:MULTISPECIES: TetR/AcrR family transcriptional regulator [unclassified Bradyrhizobium]MDI4236537.1 TetR/AcrR family transcriptional regulator [Bradyrhizobium sp. Arg237L]TAI65635.1 TetR family transcriptional regulator [Bradyrhizobium sp. Leo170]
MKKADLANETKATGRPRSAASRRAILEATHSLLDSTTVRDLTIEAIAQKAGVGKATIYRWWSSKTAIVIEVFLDSMISNTPIPRADSAADAIRKHLVLLIKQYRGKLGRIVAEILAEGQFEPEILAEFHRRFFADRRAAVREVIEAGVRDGEFAATLDIDAVIDMLYGAVNFRLIAKHLPLDIRFERSLSELSSRALGVEASALPKVVGNQSEAALRKKGGLKTGH